MLRLCLALAAALALGACATTAPSVRDGLVGRWDMARIYDDGQDVSIVHNPERDRFIVLRADGTFESGGRPYGRNTGRWAYDPEARTLGLDSDLGPEDDSLWRVSLDGDRMEWAGVGSEFARRFRIVALRAG